MNSDFEHIEIRGRTLRIVRFFDVPDRPALTALLQHAGLPTGVSVVVLVGGASGLNRAHAAVCEELFTSALVPVVEMAGAVLIDGGTDAGIMQLAGRARHQTAARFPLVGVVAEGTVRWPGRPTARQDAADLEPHHTHIVAVPGDQWGDETTWLSAVASALAGNAPSVTVLANGGAIAYDDVRESLTAARPVLVLSGTGRTADDITTARTSQTADPRAVEAATCPLLTTVPPHPHAVSTALAAALKI
ncbi:MAG: hypothetical protein DLM60_20085 [Pseudonocardiales bacterium]|nr:hypothetical protein [Actinomycetota bacterium]PZS13871.1 MAG: hypothetical protein DLM60_20085 [Pseudonocardiales bacterium]